MSSLAGFLVRDEHAMITAMARQHDKSYIFQPVGKELTDALRFDKRGYIFVEKWQYLNSDRETRCLDCIVWTNDMSIAYIRFYSDNAQQLSGTEMNAGLDRLDKFLSSHSTKCRRASSRRGARLSTCSMRQGVRRFFMAGFLVISGTRRA